ncbi:MAG: response regulator [Lachnospiraceae bacterium]|nr:response regulator [Lachnospiraceae bacterium]
MIQKKYLCKDIGAAKDAIRQAGEILSETEHRSALITFYEKGFSRREVEDLVADMKDIGRPELMIAGISSTFVAELMPEGMGMHLNLILTDEAKIEVVPVHCIPGEEEEAAGKLKSRLDACGDVRAVELFGSNMALNTTLFIEKSMEGHEDAVLFGTSTIRNLTQKVSVDKSGIVVEEETGIGAEKDELIVAGDILYDGFAAVVFSGEKLKVRSDYALGWSPVGRRFPVELGDCAYMGETVVDRINGQPAVDIYREYLGVYPDSYLISNICEFPFVVERDGINICLIPINAGKDGELYFMMTLLEGEKLRFTFASHDEVLFASRRSLEDMEKFCPEALFLTLCGNRINFLKEDAHIEWDEFGKVSPDYALMHGACELYYHNKKGGILNSAHIAVGFREGDDPEKTAEFEHPSLESLRRGKTLSLPDRMSTFLSRITTELLEIAAEADNANKAKSAFLSHMSHEIRTPINAILGMDEMILQETKETGTLDYAESIRSAGNNLLGIVNDILDFSKIEAGKMSIIPAKYELTSIINDMYNVVRLRAEDKGLKVVLDIDPCIPAVLFGDEARIKQVITNILTNAVKYTEKGTVTLCMKKAESTGEDTESLKKACPGELPQKSVKLRVSVKDTGIGIRPEDMPKLFNEYERAEEERNRKVEGTGLGISITTELLELMGSRLTVDSVYGEGSEFGFEIMQGVEGDEQVGDLSERFRKTAGRKKRVRFTAEDAKILVVDDSPVNLVVVKNLLKNTRICIDTATSGEEALRLVRENEYDVIFLDQLMPKMSGTETLKRMKELEDNRSAKAPVISLTANAGAEARDEYLSAGFRDYLSKPVSARELEDMLFYHVAPEKIRTISD